MKYRAEIDGLRALAVLPVIFFHAGFRAFSGGFVGVDVFFVISGYLITSLIVSETLGGKFTFANFYERRMRRILPALFVVMLACLPLAWFWMIPTEAKELSKSLMAVSAFVSNLLFWREGGYFETPGEFKPLLHTWSLAVEEQYYLLFPLLLLLLLHVRRRWQAATIAIAALLSLAAAEWSSRYHPQGAFYLLPTRGWELLLGALVGLYFTYGTPAVHAARARASLTNESVSAAGLLLIAYAVITFDRSIPYPGLWALVPTLGTVMLILCANQRTLVGKVLNAPLLVGIGLISYSTYLWHQPLFAFARIHNQGAVSTLALCALAAVAVALAYLSWRFVENPFRDRSRIGRRSVFIAAAAMSLLFILLGFIGYETNGFVYRYAAADRDLAALDFSQAGDYVERRFVALQDRAFDNSGRVKIVVIGDSFAQDLVNAVYEGGLTTRLQLATHWIPTRCGNLFLQQEFAAQIESSRTAICKRSGGYADPKLQGLLSQADAIWIASKWTSWEVALLPQSIRNLRQSYHASVLVFGPKNFGKFTLARLLRLTPAQRLQYRSAMLESQVQLGVLMQASLPGKDYVDVSELLCDSRSTCPLFTPDGKLVSFDGQHLTKDGAIYLGRRLSTLTPVRELILKH